MTSFTKIYKDTQRYLKDKKGLTNSLYYNTIDTQKHTK